VGGLLQTALIKMGSGHLHKNRKPLQKSKEWQGIIFLDIKITGNKFIKQI